MPNPKERIPLWIRPETIHLADELFPLDNCKSRSEFFDKAVRFYSGYVVCQDNTEYLADAVLSGIQGSVRDSENRIARLLFKQAVEIGVLNHILASYVELPAPMLTKIRGQVVEELKRTNGTVL